MLQSPFTWLRGLGALVLGMMLLALGAQYLFDLDWGKKSHSKAAMTFHKFYQRVKIFKASRSSFVIGLMAGLLPCMWLYTYVISASATQSPWAGMLVMFLFWLGGLPALSAVSMMIRPSLARANVHKQRIAGAVLTIAGLYALGAHLFSTL